MKPLYVLTLTSLLSVNTFAFDEVQDFVRGSCTFELENRNFTVRTDSDGNKSFRGGSYTTQFRPLRKSISEDVDFEIHPGQPLQLTKSFIRVIPNIPETHDEEYQEKFDLVRKKNQVVLFGDDKASIDAAEEDYEGLTGKKSFPNKQYYSLEYLSEDMRVRKDGKTISGPAILVNGTSVKGSVGYNAFALEDNKTEFKLEGTIAFNFTDFSYTGFLGIPGFFSGEVEADGVDTHKSKVTMNCKINKPEEVVQAARDAEAAQERKENSLAGELDGFEISRGSTRE